MKTLLFRMSNNLPPPPPKSSSKMLYAAIAIVIIVVAAVAGAYILMQKSPNNPNPSPTSTATPSSTAPATSTPSANPASTSTPQNTATPASTPAPSSSAQPITNFVAGKWVNYTVTTYSEGTQSAVMYEKESVDQEFYNGIDCWTITMATDQVSEGQTMTSVTKIWMSKSTLEGVHMRSEYNGVVIIDEDLNATSTTDPGTTGQIDPSTIVSYETITVAAGTFPDCAKAAITTTTPAGTSTSNVWSSQNVPIFGLVKMETFLNGQLSSTTELTDFSR
jgi:hypothetical protein